jgi:hypothetical protein
LEQEVQLMVNIARTKMEDKDLVDEYTKIRKSVWAAVDAVSAMSSPNLPFAKYIYMIDKVR